MILSKSCAAQVIVDEGVLKYLFSQSAKAYHLDKEIKLCDSVNYYQNQTLSYKDSIISNQGESIDIRNSQIEILDIELSTANAENKKLTHKATFFKFTAILVGILGSISTTYFIIY